MRIKHNCLLFSFVFPLKRGCIKNNWHTSQFGWMNIYQHHLYLKLVKFIKRNVFKMRSPMKREDERFIDIHMFLRPGHPNENIYTIYWEKGGKGHRLVWKCRKAMHVLIVINTLYEYVIFDDNYSIPQC